MRSGQRNITGRDAKPVQTVSVTRDWGGLRVMVDVARVRNPHMATDTGGIRRQLPHPMLAVYVFCDELGPVPWHSCAHGGDRHSVKVLVARVHNDPAVYATLRARAKKPRRRRPLVHQPKATV